jgi:hypothetical protein
MEMTTRKSRGNARTGAGESAGKSKGKKAGSKLKDLGAKAAHNVRGGGGISGESTDGKHKNEVEL